MELDSTGTATWSRYRITPPRPTIPGVILEITVAVALVAFGLRSNVSTTYNCGLDKGDGC